MTKSVQRVISINGSRRLIQFSAVIFTLIFIQIDAFTQKYYSFEFEGRQREYVVYLPQEFQPNLPVVFGFHGYRQGSNFISYSLLHEVADTAGFITVYPQSNPYWNTGLLYPGYPTIDTTVNDVGFISAIIDTLYAHYEIDMRRVYNCGFSHGGGMTNLLSGELSNRFAAVAAVAGLFNDNSAVRYNPVRPFPILHIHGTEDIIETWDGSKANLWSLDSTINYKLEKNGCSLPGDTVLLPDLDKTDGCTVEKISYTNCSGEGQLIFYKILGGGHSWPSSAYTFSNEGNKNKDINANVEIINFFKKFENPLVYIPDTAFLYALIEEGVDTNGDSLISYAEAEAVTSIDVSGEMEEFWGGTLICGSNRGEIISLEGIETFINLDTLNCYCNSIESLDLSSNKALTYMDCASNPLHSLDVSNNTVLTYLDCDLRRLMCDCDQLTSLDVSNNTKLEALDIYEMPSLGKVCHWDYLFPYLPDLIDVSYDNSPNVYFISKYGGIYLFAPPLLYRPEYIEVYSSTDGMIYLVPKNTSKDIIAIREACLDSLTAMPNATVDVPLTGIENGEYWLYGRDTIGYISNQVAFRLQGSTVGFDNRSTDQFRIFPNPAKSILTIESESPGLHLINITSLNGQLIFNTEMEGTTHQLDLSSFQKGVYFITIRSKDFVTTRKIVKL